MDMNTSLNLFDSSGLQRVLSFNGFFVVKDGWRDYLILRVEAFEAVAA